MWIIMGRVWKQPKQLLMANQLTKTQGMYIMEYIAVTERMQELLM